MAITFNQLKTALTSPELANYSIQEQYDYRTQAMAEFKQSPEYIFMDPMNRKGFELNVMTNDFVGYDKDTLARQGNQRALDYVNQIEQVRNGQDVELDVLDGFLDTFKNSLTGKALLGAGNVITQGSLREHFYDDNIASQLKEVRDQTFKNFETTGVTDYNIAKGVGFAAGLAADIYLTSKLYGATTAPGVLTKGITSGGVKKILSKASEYTAKQMATKLTPYWFGQMAVETAGYQVEEFIADSATGKLEQDGGFQAWLQKNFKSNLAKGFAYFLVGEAIGAGVSKAVKMYGKTFTGKGFRDQTIQQLQKMSQEDLETYFLKHVTSESISKSEEDVLKVIGQFENIKKMKRELGFLGNFNDPKEQFKYVMSRNFDVDFDITDANEYIVKTLKGEDVKKTFKDRTSFLEWVGKENRRIRNSLFENSFDSFKDRAANFTIEVRGKGKVKNVKGSYASVLPTLAPNDFRLRADNLESFIKTIQPEEGELPEIILKQDFFSNTLAPQKGKIYAPTVIDTKEKSNAFLKSLKQQVKTNFDLDSIGDINLQRYLENLGSYNKYNIDWIENVLGSENVLKRGNLIHINLPDGSVKQFADETEAGRYVHSLIIDENLLSKHLANEHGLRLKINEDKSFTVYNQHRGTSEIVAEADTVPQLLQNNPQFLPKKPISTAPSSLEFSSGEVEFNKKIGRGTFKKITDKMKQFKAQADLLNRQNVLKQERFKIDFDNVTEDYIVRLPNGLERDFPSLRAAREWATKDWTNIRTSIEELEEYGYKVTATEGGYLVRDLAGNKHAIKNKQGIIPFLENVQAIKNLDPIDGLGPEQSKIMSKNIMDQIQAMKTDYVAKGAHIKAKKVKSGMLWQEKLSKLLEPVKQSVQRHGYRDVDELLNDYLQANRLYEGKDTQTKAWIAAVLGDLNTYEKETLGKILREERALNITDLGAKLAKYDLPNDPKYFQVIQNVRNYFDRMGIVAGVSSDDYVKYYLPRFADVKFEDLVNTHMDEKNLYEAYFKGKIPANMDPFMRKMRRNDLIRSYEDNIQDIMEGYSAIAWRSRYLEDFDARLGSKIEELQKNKANPDILVQLKTVKERLVGKAYNDDAITLAQQHEHNKRNSERILSSKILKRYLDKQQLTEVAGWARKSNIASGMKALMSSALMSFKMRMPIRNMAQIWTHLGAVYDNPEILRAFKMASDNPEAIYRELVEKGIANPRQGRNSGQLLSFLRNWNQVGLNWHQNSDDFTRIIGYQTAKNRFQAAYAGLTSGKYDLKKFHNVAGSWALDEVDKIKINDLLKQGKINEAETVLESRIVEKCFFDYSSAAKPIGQNSGVTNVFMQYSTFPLNTIQLWKNSFANTMKSDPKQALASLARVSANIAGLSVLFSDLIGYSNTPTSFLEYTMFTGGPAFTAFADTVSIMGAQTTVGQKAKRIFKTNAATYTPLYGVSKATAKSLMALSQGEELMAIQYALGGSGRDQNSIIDVLSK